MKKRYLLPLGIACSYAGAQPNCGKNLTVEIKSDRFPADIGLRVQGPGVTFKKRGGFKRNQLFTKDFCVQKNAAYDVTFTDSWGDGYCCMSGHGFYRILVDGQQVVLGGRGGQSFAQRKKKVTHKILTSPRQPEGIDKQYLDAHNRRRKDWHEANGKDYRPLKWSFSLKSDAKKWAQHLSQTSCLGGQRNIYHDPENPDGENITATKGSGGWAVKPTPDKVLTRFVDRQMGKPGGPKSNSHLTQALWYSTGYVGCAEVSRDHGDGKKCHIQVCRYTQPGNCGMGDWSNWKKLTLQDSSGCGRLCPDEGCY